MPGHEEPGIEIDVADPRPATLHVRVSDVGTACGDEAPPCRVGPHDRVHAVRLAVLDALDAGVLVRGDRVADEERRAPFAAHGAQAPGTSLGAAYQVALDHRIGPGEAHAAPRGVADDV